MLVLDLGLFLLDGERLGNVDHVEHDEYHGEDAHCDPQCGSCVADRGVGRVAHQVTHQHRNDGRGNRVERTAELDQLVTLLAAAAERIEHRVDDGVEHTHREARDECADQVNRETARFARKILDTHADETDCHGRKRRLLVADALEHHTGRNPHHRIGDEVGEIAQLRHPVRHGELVLDNYAQRIRKPRHE